jgi:manganese transport protein
VKIGQIKSASTTRQAAAAVLAGQGSEGRLRRLLPFLGPAFIASVAYVDPGNFATNIQGGARFGYTLLWVIVVSNLMAILVQVLSAKLGIACGQNLAEVCRQELPRPLVWGMWLLMELVAMATDLAEFLGAALGFALLFDMPLWLGGLITASTTFLILGLEVYGFRPLEAVIGAFVGVVALCYLVETVLDRPAWGNVLYHSLVPGFAGPESVLLAAGILGATVMPHVIFLHSALTQQRIVVKKPEQKRRLYHFQILDVAVALGLASLINAAMLIMAAATFHSAGLEDIGTIEEAHRTLEPLLGGAASTVFALSLLAAGLSSASVGTMAGQVIMQGFLRRRIPTWLRRLVTMLPSLVVIAMGLDPTRMLVLSQVVLSFGLPFAIVPLVLFTRRADIMGVLVNRRLTTVAASAVATLVVALNLYLLFTLFNGGEG